MNCFRRSSTHVDLDGGSTYRRTLPDFSDCASVDEDVSCVYASAAAGVDRSSPLVVGRFRLRPTSSAVGGSSPDGTMSITVAAQNPRSVDAVLIRVPPPSPVAKSVNPQSYRVERSSSTGCKMIFDRIDQSTILRPAALSCTAGRLCPDPPSTRTIFRRFDNLQVSTRVMTNTSTPDDYLNRGERRRNNTSKATRLLRRRRKAGDNHENETVLQTSTAASIAPIRSGRSPTERFGSVPRTMERRLASVLEHHPRRQQRFIYNDSTRASSDDEDGRKNSSPTTAAAAGGQTIDVYHISDVGSHNVTELSDNSSKATSGSRTEADENREFVVQWLRCCDDVNCFQDAERCPIYENL